MRVVGPQDHRIGVGRVEERRPAAMGFELLGAAEQLRAAGPTLVDALGVVSVYSPVNGALGARAPQHLELLRGEFFAPFASDSSSFGPDVCSLMSSTLAGSSRVIQRGSMPNLQTILGLGVEIAEVQHGEHHDQHQRPALGDLQVLQGPTGRRPVHRAAICQRTGTRKSPATPASSGSRNSAAPPSSGTGTTSSSSSPAPATAPETMRPTARPRTW